MSEQAGCAVAVSSHDVILGTPESRLAAYLNLKPEEGDVLSGPSGFTVLVYGRVWTGLYPMQWEGRPVRWYRGLGYPKHDQAAVDLRETSGD